MKFQKNREWFLWYDIHWEIIWISSFNNCFCVEIKDEPVRFLKKADMLESACRLMNKDLEDINEEISKKNKVIEE